MEGNIFISMPYRFDLMIYLHICTKGYKGNVKLSVTRIPLHILSHDLSIQGKKICERTWSPVIAGFMCVTELRANSSNKLFCLRIHTRRANCFVCEFILKEATGSQILMLHLERLSMMVCRVTVKKGVKCILRYTTWSPDSSSSSLTAASTTLSPFSTFPQKECCHSPLQILLQWLQILQIVLVYRTGHFRHYTKKKPAKPPLFHSQ